MNKPRLNLTIIDYCYIYMWCSVAFYVLMLLCPSVSFWVGIGAHAGYYVIAIFQILVLDSGILSPGSHVFFLGLILETVFFASFYFCLKLAIKDNVIPFSCFIIINHLLAIGTVVLSRFVGTRGYLPMCVIWSVVANTIYILLFIKQASKR